MELQINARSSSVPLHHIVGTAKRIPTKIRSNDGTENSIIEALQITLRRNNQDEHAGIASFIIGNVDSESKDRNVFWSQILKDRPGWWRDFLADLSKKGLLDSANQKLEMSYMM